MQRFLKDILPGATPLSDPPGAYTAKAIHERFLAARNLRLIPDGGIVRQTILRAVSDGKLVVRLPDGRVYDDEGCVEGSEGRRRRIPGLLTTLPLDDTVLLALANSDLAARWTREDRPEEKKRKKDDDDIVPPPPILSRVLATSWEQALEYVVDRPLLQLQLFAHTPATADALAGLAQPFGADSLSLSVSVSGSLKDRGTMSFSASEVKPTHPAKPLTIAETIFNSLVEGSDYEVELRLSFGEAGRTGIESQLKNLAENAPEDLAFQATFDKPVGGGD